MLSTFTAPDGTLITDYAGEIGSDIWSQQSSYVPATNATISGNGLYFPAIPAAYRANGVPPSADYYVEAVLDFKTAVGVQNPGPAGRMDIAVNTMYFCRYHAGNLGWEMFKIVSGTATQLGTLVAAAFPTGETRALRLTMIGTTISMQVDGVTILSVTDSSISGAGRAGLRVGGTANAPTTGIHIASILARAA